MYDSFKDMAFSVDSITSKEGLIDLLNGYGAETARNLAKDLGFASKSKAEAMRAINLYCDAKIHHANKPAIKTEDL